MTKWFITDMDGTFLNDKREIAPNSKEVMKKLQDKGIKFLIATGRVDIAVKNYYYQMGLNEATISCNGSFIRNQSTGEVLFADAFDYEQLKVIYNKYKELTDGSIEFHVYSANYIYCDKLSFNLARIQKVEQNIAEELKTPMCIREDILTAIAENKDECYKVMISSENHPLLEKIYTEVNGVFEVSGTFSATNFFDIMPVGTNKGEGIRRVAEYYGINMEDSVVFGDNLNDIEMLKVAGMSICPSNAKQEIKDLCDLVIGENNDFSVLKYIEDYVDSLEN